jgi:hypothetical protein
MDYVRIKTEYGYVKVNLKSQTHITVSLEAEYICFHNHGGVIIFHSSEDFMKNIPSHWVHNIKCHAFPTNKDDLLSVIGIVLTD